jgi:hypothetical protein
VRSGPARSRPRVGRAAPACRAAGVGRGRPAVIDLCVCVRTHRSGSGHSTFTLTAGLHPNLFRTGKKRYIPGKPLLYEDAKAVTL